MYPVRLGYSTAVQRVNELMANGHNAEALLTSVFTLEKTLRRTLRQLVISAGFISRMADKVVKNLRGIEAVNSAWELYDPKHRTLTKLIAPSDWQTLKHVVDMRNKLVHGERVYKLADCSDAARRILSTLDNIKKVLDDEYAYSGWTAAASRRTSQLHKDPKVRVASV